jgi:hypothetical protein
MFSGHLLVWDYFPIAPGSPLSILLLLVLEAVQLQRRFGLLNEFFSFGSVSDAALPVSYSHFCYITFYITLPPVFESSL